MDANMPPNKKYKYLEYDHLIGSHLRHDSVNCKVVRRSHAQALIQLLIVCAGFQRGVKVLCFGPCEITFLYQKKKKIDKYKAVMFSPLFFSMVNC